MLPANHNYLRSCHGVRVCSRLLVVVELPAPAVVRYCVAQQPLAAPVAAPAQQQVRRVVQHPLARLAREGYVIAVVQVLYQRAGVCEGVAALPQAGGQQAVAARGQDGLQVAPVSPSNRDMRFQGLRKDDCSIVPRRQDVQHEAQAERTVFTRQPEKPISMTRSPRGATRQLSCRSIAAAMTPAFQHAIPPLPHLFISSGGVRRSSPTEKIIPAPPCALPP